MAYDSSSELASLDSILRINLQAISCHEAKLVFNWKVHALLIKLLCKAPYNSLHAARLYIGARRTISLCGASIYRVSCTCSRVPALSEGEVPRGYGFFSHTFVM